MYLVVRLDDANSPRGPGTVVAITDDYPELSSELEDDPKTVVWPDDAVDKILVGDRVVNATTAVRKYHVKGPGK